MQPAIQLTFATREDFEAFIARECALRTAAPRQPPGPEMEAALRSYRESFHELEYGLRELDARIAQHERVLCKVVETNQQLHQRIKALEEDTLVTDWASEPAAVEAA